MYFSSYFLGATFLFFDNKITMAYINSVDSSSDTNSSDEEFISRVYSLARDLQRAWVGIKPPSDENILRYVCFDVGFY